MMNEYIEEMNKERRLNNKRSMRPCSLYDIDVFLSILLIGRIEGHTNLWGGVGNGKDYTDMIRKEDTYGGSVDVSKTHMSRTRFNEIKSCFIYLNANRSKSDSTDEDNWWQVDHLIQSFNDNRKKVYRSSGKITLDETMSEWKPRSTAKGNLKHLSYIKRKPKEFGTELKSGADGEIGKGVMMYYEIQKGKEAMKDAPFVNKLKHKTAACTKRLMVGCSAPLQSEEDSLGGTTVHPKRELFVADSWFGCITSILAAAKLGLFLICIVKIYSAHTPKRYIEERMASWPPGSHLVLEAEIDGEIIYCMGYKYSQRTVLTFLFNKGAAHTEAGDPYRAQWIDSNGIPVDKYVYRPYCAALFFLMSNLIDGLNHQRQGVLSLEQIWKTHCGFYRINQTINK